MNTSITERVPDEHDSQSKWNNKNKIWQELPPWRAGGCKERRWGPQAAPSQEPAEKPTEGLLCGANRAEILLPLLLKRPADDTIPPGSMLLLVSRLSQPTKKVKIGMLSKPEVRPPTHKPESPTTPTPCQQQQH